MKKILFGIVCILSFLLIITDVSAADDPVCFYYTAESGSKWAKNTKIYFSYKKTNNKGKVVVKGKKCLHDKNRNASVNDGESIPTSISCSLDGSTLPGTFVYANDKLYCPSIVYAKYRVAPGGANTITIDYSLDAEITNKDVNGNYSYTDYIKLTIVPSETKNGAVVYQSLEYENENVNGTNYLAYTKTCDLNFDKDYEQLLNYKKQVDALKKPSADTITKILDTLILVKSKSYCERGSEIIALADEINEKAQTLLVGLSGELSEEEINEIDVRNKELERQTEARNASDMEFLKYKTAKLSCDQMLDTDLIAVIKLALKWIRIGAPIVLIILVAVDFSQAVISNDKDAVNKAVSKAIKRGIAAIVLFFIPLIVSVMIDWIGDAEGYYDKDLSDCSVVFESK